MTQDIENEIEEENDEKEEEKEEEESDEKVEEERDEKVEEERDEKVEEERDENTEEGNDQNNEEDNDEKINETPDSSEDSQETSDDEGEKNEGPLELLEPSEPSDPSEAQEDVSSEDDSEIADGNDFQDTTEPGSLISDSENVTNGDNESEDEENLLPDETIASDSDEIEDNSDSQFNSSEESIPESEEIPAEFEDSTSHDDSVENSVDNTDNENLLVPEDSSDLEYLPANDPELTSDIETSAESDSWNDFLPAEDLGMAGDDFPHEADTDDPSSELFPGEDLLLDSEEGMVMIQLPPELDSLSLEDLENLSESDSTTTSGDWIPISFGDDPDNPEGELLLQGELSEASFDPLEEEMQMSWEDVEATLEDMTSSSDLPEILIEEDIFPEFPEISDILYDLEPNVNHGDVSLEDLLQEEILDPNLPTEISALEDPLAPMSLPLEVDSYDLIIDPELEQYFEFPFDETQLDEPMIKNDENFAPNEFLEDPSTLNEHPILVDPPPLNPEIDSESLIPIEINSDEIFFPNTTDKDQSDVLEDFTIENLSTDDISSIPELVDPKENAVDETHFLSALHEGDKQDCEDSTSSPISDLHDDEVIIEPEEFEIDDISTLESNMDSDSDAFVESEDDSRQQRVSENTYGPSDGYEDFLSLESPSVTQSEEIYSELDSDLQITSPEIDETSLRDIEPPFEDIDSPLEEDHLLNPPNSEDIDQFSALYDSEASTTAPTQSYTEFFGDKCSETSKPNISPSSPVLTSSECEEETEEVSEKKTNEGNGEEYTENTVNHESNAETCDPPVSTSDHPPSDPLPSDQHGLQMYLRTFNSLNLPRKQLLDTLYALLHTLFPSHNSFLDLSAQELLSFLNTLQLTLTHVTFRVFMDLLRDYRHFLHKIRQKHIFQSHKRRQRQKMRFITYQPPIPEDEWEELQESSESTAIAFYSPYLPFMPYMTFQPQMSFALSRSPSLSRSLYFTAAGTSSPPSDPSPSKTSASSPSQPSDDSLPAEPCLDSSSADPELLTLLESLEGPLISPFARVSTLEDVQTFDLSTFLHSLMEKTLRSQSHTSPSAYFEAMKQKAFQHYCHSHPYIYLSQQAKSSRQPVILYETSYPANEALILTYFMESLHLPYDEACRLLHEWKTGKIRLSSSTPYGPLPDFAVPLSIAGTVAFQSVTIGSQGSHPPIFKSNALPHLEYLKELLDARFTFKSFLESRHNKIQQMGWFQDVYTMVRNIAYVACTAWCTKSLKTLARWNLVKSIQNYVTKLRTKPPLHDLWIAVNHILHAGLLLEHYGFVTRTQILEQIFTSSALHDLLPGRSDTRQDWLSANLETLVALSPQWRVLSPPEKSLIQTTLGDGSSDITTAVYANLRHPLHLPFWKPFLLFFELLRKIFRLGTPEAFGSLIKNTTTKKNSATALFPLLPASTASLTSNRPTTVVTGIINDFFKIYLSLSTPLFSVKDTQSLFVKPTRSPRYFSCPVPQQTLALDVFLQFFCHLFFRGNWTIFNTWHRYATRQFYQGGIEPFSGNFLTYSQLLELLSAQLDRRTLLTRYFTIEGKLTKVIADSFFERDILDDLKIIEPSLRSIQARETFNKILRHDSINVKYQMDQGDGKGKTTRKAILDIGATFKIKKQLWGLLLECLGFKAKFKGKLYALKKELQLLAYLACGFAPLYIPYDDSTTRRFYFNQTKDEKFVQNVRYIGIKAPLLSRYQFKKLLVALSLSQMSLIDTLRHLSDTSYYEKWKFNSKKGAKEIQVRLGLIVNNSYVEEIITSDGKINPKAINSKMLTWWINFLRMNKKFINKKLNLAWIHLHFKNWLEEYNKKHDV
ncbi:hypothetical protein NEF87_002689 [Candidatus Lokiarchaeum ossiferum]|uniref:Uncharacterized protein n=1 Tax=Candidatus Lokiarchaeum ossiferum TaxID=2951803 RepID=A0ABY6HSB8_9ARCH|nr:hypothetical protein NEF87_002689 [Candidatus Lokiarchaeum sp. B-35]